MSSYEFLSAILQCKTYKTIGYQFVNKYLYDYLVALKKAQCLTLKAVGWDLKKTQLRR